MNLRKNSTDFNAVPTSLLVQQPFYTNTIMPVTYINQEPVNQSIVFPP